MTSTDQSDTYTDPDTLILSPSLSLNVAFSFDSQWSLGPNGHLSTFPPGSALTARTIVIGPVNLSGLSAEQIATIVAHRTADMALVTTAIAVATRPLAAALDDANGT